MSLIRPQLVQREINSLSRAIIQKMEIVLGKTMRENNIQKQREKKFPLQNENKRRCFHCLEHCKTKKEKDILGKSREQCELCETSTCGAHSTNV